MEELALIFLMAYITGSFSPAHLAGKIKGIDLTKEGSGNLGARNVKRMVGKGAAVTVLVADIFKGCLATWLAIQISDHQLAGGIGWLGVITGHGFPFYLKFKGGKGLASSAGALILLSPLLLLSELAAGAVIFALSRNLYAASIGMAAALPLLAFLLAKEALFVPSFPIAILMFWFHRGNIRQLLKRE